MPNSVKPTSLLVSLVVAGGVAGSAIRVAFFELIPSDGFPWPTVAINLLGAGLIGLLLPRLRGRHHHMALAVLGVGGTATTFSTLTLDTVTLLEVGRYTAVLGYLTLSLVGGFLLAALGLRMGRVR